jgi:response regulator NasT
LSIRRSRSRAQGVCAHGTDIALQHYPEPLLITVLIVDHTQARASALRDALAAMDGVRVACTLDSPLELPARVAEFKPDVVLIDTESPSRDVLEQLAVMNASAPRPVVMFSDDAGDAPIRDAIRAGVSAYIVDGLSPGRLQPIMRVAMERFEAEQRLRAELVDTREKLASRKVVERAKGILMKQRRVTEDEAFTMLREHAMARGLKLADAAKQVIDIASLLG